MTAQGQGFLLPWILLVSAFVVHILPTSGMYEDQIGKFDWHQQYIGAVRQAMFDQSAPVSKRIFVGTESNVVAAINSRTGQLAWRHVQERGDPWGVDVVLHKNSILVTVCNGGDTVRAWDPASGTLLWEFLGKEGNDSPAKALLVEGKQDDRSYVESVAVLTKKTLRILSAVDGHEMVSTEVWPSGESGGTAVLHQASNGQLYSVSISTQSTVQIVSYSHVPGKGYEAVKRVVAAGWASPQSTQCVVTGDNILVCSEASTNSLYTMSLVDGSTFSAVTLLSLGFNSWQPDSLALKSVQVGRKEVLLRLAKDHFVLLQATASTLTVLKDFPDVYTTTTARSQERDIMFFVKKGSKDELVVTGFYLENLKEDQALTQMIAHQPHFGSPQQVTVYTFLKRDSSTGYRALLQMEDQSLLMLQQLQGNQGHVMWQRNEALASISAVDQVDLPVSETESKFEEEFGEESEEDLSVWQMFTRRITTQLEQLKDLADKFEEYRRPKAKQVEKQLERDPFNLRKMIVVVTSAGKLYGLDSANGDVVWQYFLPNIQCFSQGEMYLFVQRTTAHFPHPPQAMLVAQEKATGNGLVFTFNPTTGQPVNTSFAWGTPQPFKVLQANLLPVMNNHHLHPVMIVDSDHGVHIFPPSPSVLSVLKKNNGKIFLHAADLAKSTLTGFSLTTLQDGKVELSQAWHLSLPIPSQRIVSVVPRRANEHVHSQGRVLSDRSVMYKYLNPNLLAVMTEGIERDVPLLTLYLVDAVTGQVVYSMQHKRASGPVHLVHSENWVVYHYWNGKFRRHEVTVLELFESQGDRNSTTFSSLSTQSLPLVLQQAYIFPTGLTAMAVSNTERGITARSLLLALPNGGLMTLPKNILDPRRPIIPTKQHQEEGVYPYIPELHINPMTLLTYNQSVEGIRGIHIGAAGLESTSVVLAYGLDLFYTRIMPSQMFDVLKEDFDYFFISSILLGLVMATLITHRLAAMKTLNRSWR
ncbi:PREDICTED: ER membrane protein complex subunit 1-like isoform X2 [Branchiostoma belcheri]|uniref:ER membrane protein complex subunit 1 n=1 Tax=Branchiostoma belcheri TaxID=7741 RepID=A0A6P4ZB95_BRABE|nr:PREDICTED: ER membrane protein complex subunit 1-like isoform X1 [Branchiostoma belcheri]XP_019633908.1 PREDICTED: ER membrane protein complex subunit 1-like isoform X2 [Branchiostoma belcheri]